MLSKALQALKLSVAVQSKQRPFWQARYYDFNVFTSDKRVEKLRYMHRNPIKRGLVSEPLEWAWSSFRHYATGEQRVVIVRPPEPMSQKRDMGHPELWKSDLGHPPITRFGGMNEKQGRRATRKDANRFCR